MLSLLLGLQEVCILSLATEFGGDTMTLLNFFGLVLCLLGISVHVIHKATKGLHSVGIVITLYSQVGYFPLCCLLVQLYVTGL